MPEIEIKDRNNKVVGKMSLSEGVFGREAGEGLIHSAVVNTMANQRQGTHATKNRALVSGGGKKPYRQKKTGRARAGSNRSPIWRGGGTIFGPMPRDYSYSMPKKARRLALWAALTRKLQDGEVAAVDSFAIDKPSTKAMVAVLKDMGLEGGSVLVVIPERDDMVLLSARNIPAVSVKLASDLNAHDVATYRKLLFTKGALEAIEARGREE